MLSAAGRFLLPLSPAGQITSSLLPLPLALPAPPPLPPQVRQTIIEDLGQPPEALYREFAQAPIASASLAQVHEATDHDGRHLAVKVRPAPPAVLLYAPRWLLAAVVRYFCCHLLLWYCCLVCFYPPPCFAYCCWHPRAHRSITINTQAAP